MRVLELYLYLPFSCLRHETLIFQLCRRAESRTPTFFFPYPDSARQMPTRPIFYSFACVSLGDSSPLRVHLLNLACSLGVPALVFRSLSFSFLSFSLPISRTHAIWSRGWNIASTSLSQKFLIFRAASNTKRYSSLQNICRIGNR